MAADRKRISPLRMVKLILSGSILIFSAILLLNSCNKEENPLLQASKQKNNENPANSVSTAIQAPKKNNNSDILMKSCLSTSGSQIYSGRLHFSRGTRTPVPETKQLGKANFSHFTNEFVLNVKNGSSSSERVTSAVIKIDGKQIFGPSDFSKNVASLSKPIPNLTNNSVLEVELRGKPGECFDLWIDGKPGAVPESKEKMLYVGAQIVDSLLTRNARGSHYREIIEWEKAGYYVVVTSTMPPIDVEDSPDNYVDVITEELLAPYAVLRLANYVPHYYTDEEGEAINKWVMNGGRLLADVHYNADIKSVSAFGVDRIESNGGDEFGHEMFYYGNPLEINMDNMSGYFYIGKIGIESMDRPYLKTDHGFSISATHEGYPAVVYKDHGSGKVVITFDGGSYSQDVVNPNKPYGAACITMKNNFDFVKKIIEYFEP